MREF
jgi:hypothetical protein